MNADNLPSLAACLSAYRKRCKRDGACLLSPRVSENHYGEIICDGRRIGAHRAVVLLRDGEIPDGMFVLHSCDRPACIESSHLSVGTSARNSRDAYDRSRRAQEWAHGVNHPCARLDEPTVIYMRLRAMEGHSIQAIAADEGLPHGTAHAAIRGISWSHVRAVPPVPGRKNKVGSRTALRLIRPDDCQRAIELADKGASYAHIAKEIGVSKTTAFTMVNGSARRNFDFGDGDAA